MNKKNILQHILQRVFFDAKSNHMNHTILFYNCVALYFLGQVFLTLKVVGEPTIICYIAQEFIRVIAFYCFIKKLQIVIRLLR